MAIGFTPKYQEEYPLDNLTPSQFLALVNETAVKINLNIIYLSDIGMIAYTENGMFKWNGELKVMIQGDTATIISTSTGSDMIDLGKNKKNVRRFVESLEQLKQELTIQDLDDKFLELKDNLVPEEEDILKLPPETTAEQFKGFFSIFVPTENYFFTPIILDINLILFILMLISGVNLLSPDVESLLNWGANFRPMTLDGEWWRILSSCFIHIGILHLLMNMYALIYIGLMIEPLLGSRKFIFAYLLTGIASSMSSLWWNDYTVSAGASGAIFGMYGVFLALLLSNLIDKDTRKALLTSIGIFVGYNLISGLKDGIDNAAHIGGLLSGMLIGLAFIPSLKKPEEKRMEFGVMGALAILILGASTYVYQVLPNDTKQYEEQLTEVNQLELKALEIYNIPADTSRAALLNAIKVDGIANWEKCIVIIDGFKSLDLPSELKRRNRILRDYCNLRLKSNELYYKQVLEDTDKYEAELEECYTQIESKINELGGGQD